MECLKADYVEVWAASQNLPLARFADRSRSIAATGSICWSSPPPNS